MEGVHYFFIFMLLHIRRTINPNLVGAICCFFFLRIFSIIKFTYYLQPCSQTKKKYRYCAVFSIKMVEYMYINLL